MKYAIRTEDPGGIHYQILESRHETLHRLTGLLGRRPETDLPDRPLFDRCGRMLLWSAVPDNARTDELVELDLARDAIATGEPLSDRQALLLALYSL